MGESRYVIVTRYRDITHVYGPYASKEAARSDIRSMQRADRKEYGDGDTPQMGVHVLISDPPH